MQTCSVLWIRERRRAHSMAGVMTPLRVCNIQKQAHGRKSANRDSREPPVVSPPCVLDVTGEHGFLLGEMVQPDSSIHGASRAGGHVIDDTIA